jgi:hypothetical protein
VAGPRTPGPATPASRPARSRGNAPQSSHNGGGRWGWQSGSKLPKFCFSRLKPGSTCKYAGKCRYDHESPVALGTFKSADDLVAAGSWDQAKADQANAAR